VRTSRRSFECCDVLYSTPSCGEHPSIGSSSCLFSPLVFGIHQERKETLRFLAYSTVESITAPAALPACSHLLSVALASQSLCLSLTGSLIGSVEPIGCLAGPLESSGSGQLQKDQRWDASHYGNLEQFIYDYLVGGASAGESVRLKLQTPLFVADAILQAAQRQLDEELQTATQARPHVHLCTPCCSCLFV
jgi:hypothetical protein